MKHTYRAIFAALLTMLLASPATATPQLKPVVITEGSNGKTVAVKMGTPLQVRLSSTPSTGYTWVVRKSDSRFIRQTAPSTLLPGKSRAPGSPQTQVFPFKILKAGKTTVELAYLRVWEKHKRPAETLKVVFEILK